MTAVTPPNEAATGISYPSPTLTVVSRNGGAGLVTSTEYSYDGLGRLIRERRLMPDGQYSKRFTLYDQAGNAFFESEWVTDGTSEAVTANVSTTCSFASGGYPTYRPSAAAGTYRLCFDPFGRAQNVVGSMHSSYVTVNRGDAVMRYSDTLEVATTGCVNGTFSGAERVNGSETDSFCI